MSHLPSALIPGPAALSKIRNLVPLAHHGSVYLFQGDGKTLFAAMQELIFRFAMQGEVKVVVGANRISFDRLPLILGDRAGEAYEIMDRILVSRAETCFQMQDVLAYLEPGPSPIVITDMLQSFYEKDLSVNEVSLLLKKCVRRIHQLSETAPILISAEGNAERPILLETLERLCDQRFYFQTAEDIDIFAQTELRF
jgi:hypothetical protein